MGGGQALSIGLANPKVFSYVLGFSAAVGGQFLDMKDVLPEAGAPSVRSFRLVWRAGRGQDSLFKADQEFAAAVRQRGVELTYRETEGGHVWSVWRENLRDSLPLLFR